MRVSRVIHRLSLRALGVMLFLSLALLTSTRALYADTVTIVDGNGVTNTGPDVFDDAYIEAQLAAGNYTLDTLNASGGGPDEVRMAAGAVITWTSGFSLRLQAQQQIVISGTIQHDGPANGSGGVALLAGGDVVLGQGTQPYSITVGSRFGLTRLDGNNVRLQAGDASDPARSVLVGFRAVDQGATYTVSGPISVTALLSVTGEAGAAPFNFVQIGHGGTFSESTGLTDGLLIGDIAIDAGGSILFSAGISESTYAQVGNGGISVLGNHSGNHTLNAGGSIVFTGGVGDGGAAYAQVGNGGYDADGNQSGSHRLTAGGPIEFTAGIRFANYAQVGNGGYDVDGNHSGSHRLDAVGSIEFTAGASAGSSAYAQVGNGGFEADGNHSGDQTLDANGGAIAFTAGRSFANYAQVGNGGYNADAVSGHSGSHTLNANGDITFVGGLDIGSSAYAQVGNGGYDADGDHSGDQTLDANGGAIAFTAGSGFANYAQVGNGGYDADAVSNHSGNDTLRAAGPITFTSGISVGSSAYVQVGNGGYTANGNHSGNHLLDAAGPIVFTAGSGNANYAQVGNGGWNADTAIGQTGDITLSTASAISFTAGFASSQAYAQVGNGGYDTSGDHSGNHTLNASGPIAFTAGSGSANYAQVGNGGFNADATSGHSGNLALTTTGAILFTAGGPSNGAYAQVGNGGHDADGGHSGDVALYANGPIEFTGGSGAQCYAQAGNGGYDTDSLSGHSGNLIITTTTSDITFTAGTALNGPYAQAGNGGYLSSGNHSGNHTLYAAGAITFKAGTSTVAYAQVGNGGYNALGNHSGNNLLNAGGAIDFTAGAAFGSYAQSGNGGYDADGNHSGDNTLNAGGAIVFAGGSGFETYAQAGNGGFFADGSQSGDHRLTTALDIFLVGGRQADSYAQVGNGGLRATGPLSGSIELTATGSLSMTGGVTTSAYAQLGHGAAITNTSGTRSGDITVRLGEDLLLNGAHIGHVSGDGSGAVTSGNTLIAVSLNNPYSSGSGEILATNTPTLTVGFNSAYSPTGELRFYVPDQLHVSIPMSTPVNSELFPGAIPLNRLAGHHFFAAGPYILGADYAFYFGGQPDVAIDQAIVPIGDLLPGQPLTFLLVFSNSGVITAPNASISDTVPGSFNVTGVTEMPDAGVLITATGSAPNLSWNVSNLGPGQGGTILIHAIVNPLQNTDVGFVNNASITSTLDITLPNNLASIGANVVVPSIQFSPTTYSVLENAGTANLKVVLDRVNPYATLAVTATTSDNSAEAGSDYDGGSFAIVVPAGDISTTFAIDILPNNVVEPDEAFGVTLSNAQGGSLGAASVANVLIRNDDSTLSVTKVANADLANVGETITYNYFITNTGPLTFTALVATDDALGSIPLTPATLEPGDSATGVHTYTVQLADLPGPLEDTVNVTGTTMFGAKATASASASVDLVNAAFAFTKTVGIQGINPECTDDDDIQAPVSTTIVYCFTIVNTGNVALTKHTLEDSQLGLVLDNSTFTVAPNATFVVTQTRTLFTGVTNTAVWSAGYAGSDSPDVVQAAALPAQANAQATVRISDADDDQDGDGVPDNVEGAGDVDNDNIPNFLDPTTPGPTRLLLPSVHKGS